MTMRLMTLMWFSVPRKYASAVLFVIMLSKESIGRPGTSELELTSRSSGCRCRRLMLGESGYALALPDVGAGGLATPPALLDGGRTSSASTIESGDRFGGCAVDECDCAERVDVADVMLSKLLPDAERACVCDGLNCDCCSCCCCAITAITAS